MGIGLDELTDIAIVDTGGDELAIAADGSIAITDNGGSLTVDAVDFDIRDLTHVSDSIKIGDGTDFLEVNADGSINVSFSVVTADDEADANNPLKVGGRGVSGLLTALSATNDRYDLLGDLYRRTWVNNSANVAIKTTAETVGVAAAQIVAVPLAGRKTVTLQNEGSVDVFFGPTGVTVATGMKISKKSSATYELAEDIDIFMISGSAGQDVRVLEAG